MIIAHPFPLFKNMMAHALHDQFAHHFVLGVVPPNMFDQLHTASFIGGFNANIRSHLPAMSHYISTGMEPFVAVYTAMEVTLPVVQTCRFN